MTKMFIRTAAIAAILCPAIVLAGGQPDPTDVERWTQLVDAIPDDRDAHIHALATAQGAGRLDAATVSAQYDGEWMAPAAVLAAPTEWMEYDIHADAKSAQALQDAAARTKRIESFIGTVQFFNHCMPLCVVTAAAGITPPGAYAWLQECGLNCLVQATGVVPDYVHLSTRKVPRGGKRHRTHPPLDKRIERLERLERP